MRYILGRRGFLPVFRIQVALLVVAMTTIHSQLMPSRFEKRYLPNPMAQVLDFLWGPPPPPPGPPPPGPPPWYPGGAMPSSPYYQPGTLLMDATGNNNVGFRGSGYRSTNGYSGGRGPANSASSSGNRGTRRQRRPPLTEMISDATKIFNLSTRMVVNKGRIFSEVFSKVVNGLDVFTGGSHDSETGGSVAHAASSGTGVTADVHPSSNRIPLEQVIYIVDNRNHLSQHQGKPPHVELPNYEHNPTPPTKIMSYPHHESYDNVYFTTLQPSEEEQYETPPPTKNVGYRVPQEAQEYETPPPTKNVGYRVPQEAQEYETPPPTKNVGYRVPQEAQEYETPPPTKNVGYRVPQEAPASNNAKENNTTENTTVVEDKKVTSESPETTNKKEVYKIPPFKRIPFDFPLHIFQRSAN